MTEKQTRIDEPAPATDGLREAAVKHMAERFLAWKLPDNFNPDGGVIFDRGERQAGTAWWPTGTNLLTYTQAKAMVEHMMEGFPALAQPAPEHSLGMYEPAPEPASEPPAEQITQHLQGMIDRGEPIRLTKGLVLGGKATPEPPLTFRDRAALAALTGMGTWIPEGGGTHLGHSNALEARAKWAVRQADALEAAREAGK